MLRQRRQEYGNKHNNAIVSASRLPQVMTNLVGTQWFHPQNLQFYANHVIHTTLTTTTVQVMAMIQNIPIARAISSCLWWHMSVLAMKLSWKLFCKNIPIARAISSCLMSWFKVVMAAQVSWKHCENLLTTLRTLLKTMNWHSTKLSWKLFENCINWHMTSFDNRALLKTV